MFTWLVSFITCKLPVCQSKKLDQLLNFSTSDKIRKEMIHSKDKEHFNQSGKNCPLGPCFMWGCIWHPRFDRSKWSISYTQMLASWCAIMHDSKLKFRTIVKKYNKYYMICHRSSKQMDHVNIQKKCTPLRFRLIICCFICFWPLSEM